MSEEPPKDWLMTFLQFFITVLPWALLVTILVLLYLIFLKHE